MARGRMLNRKAFLNEELAEIYNGDLGLGAWMVWSALIANADRDGLTHGSAMVIKSYLPLAQNITPEYIESVLVELNRRGFVKAYQADGKRYLYLPKFRDNQRGLRVDREPPSEFPPFDASSAPTWRQGDANVAPARRTKGREGKGREGKGREGNICQTRSESDDCFSVLDFYLSKYPRRKVQAKDPKSRRLVAARLKDYSAEQLKTAIIGNAASKYHSENGYNSIELIFRDAKHVDMFIEYAEKPPSEFHGKRKKGWLDAQKELMEEFDNAGSDRVSEIQPVDGGTPRLLRAKTD